MPRNKYKMEISSNATEHFTDLGKLNFLMVVWFQAQANLYKALITNIFDWI